MLPKVKSLGRRSPSLSFFPLPLPPAVLLLPLSPSCVSGEEEGRAWCCGVVDLAWSEEEVAVHREGPSWVWFFVTSRDFLCPSQSGRIGSPSGFTDSFTAFPILPSSLCCVWMVCGQPGIEDPVGLPPCWCRDGSVRRDIRGGVGPLGRDLIATRLVVAIRLSRRASRSRQDCCRGAFLPGRNRAIAVPFPVVMVSRQPWGSRQYLCCLSHVVVSGVKPQLVQAAVACVGCFCGGSVSPFAGVEAGARLANRACGLWVPPLGC
ncbi:hypothetical protein Taro_042474 [Colocasia esculenta]|uniref:Uncharacterized protein n=1 Tax=Colocasia esculenta TaxID=4460 RepID=A0A843X2P2_COLES|nr:hypothetical protein [Colocasia esculenta]